MDKNLVKSLQNTGVDTRFVSIMDDKIFINNLKLSRFSRRKEELFRRRFPQIEVIRSKIFQKICTRASRNLAHRISPKERIFVVNNDEPLNIALKTILEPYQRKYGIEIVYGDNIDESIDLNADSIALPITLDDEGENILNLILNGNKIKLLSSNNTYKGKKLVYPLINVPRSWIYSWKGIRPEITNEKSYEDAENLLKFLESLIPNVRENLLKSALFIHNE